LNATEAEEGESENGGNSLVDEGSSSTRRNDDRAAQDGRGRWHDADAATRARRDAMRQRFMRAAQLVATPFAPFSTRRGGRRGKTKGKGNAANDARAVELRKTQNRSAKRDALLRRLVSAKTPVKTMTRALPREKRQPSHQPL
jgi:transcription initiation factor TFIIIB Brf1 subunit/transcription initiation factor TFIIB